jgi:calcineurin-like phosphoesterase family protein
MSGKYKDFVKIASNSQIDYVGSDYHLGHGGDNSSGGILRHTDRKHFFKNIKESDEYVIETHNSIVRKSDYVMLVGDIAFERHEYYINALNGKKILVIGSHDQMSVKLLERFSGVYPYHIRNIGNTLVTFSHCPMLTWEKMHYGSYNVHGHTHGRIREDEKLRHDAGFDVCFGPWPWELVVKKMELKKSGEFLPDYSSARTLDDVTRVLAKNNLQFLSKYDTVQKVKVRKDILDYHGVS